MVPLFQMHEAHVGVSQHAGSRLRLPPPLRDVKDDVSGGMGALDQLVR
jgi:hypothetical protein